jgi:hypothetical protein
VKTQVAKQGFLIKSSGGKKDSVGTATGAFLNSGTDTDILVLMSLPAERPQDRVEA